MSDAEHLNFKSSQTVSSDVNLESTPSRSSCPLLFDPRGCGYIHSASRSLAHKIIEEEMSKIETPASANTLLQVDLPEVSLLDAEADNSRKRPFQEYYALKVEAETILVESKKQWIDTPFSASVVQGKHVGVVINIIAYGNVVRLPATVRCGDDTIHSARVFKELQTVAF